MAKESVEALKWTKQIIECLKKDLREIDFSIELIEECRNDFQMIGGSLYEPTVKEFRELFIKKVKESNVNLSEERANQLVEIVRQGGGLRFKDIVFVDDTAFEIYYPSESMIKYDGFKDKDYITYHFSSERYLWRSFFDLTGFFLPNRFNLSDEELTRLRDEINNIFITYFNNHNCPSKLGLSYGSDRHVDNFAISSNKEEIENGLLNRTPFNVSIIGKDGTGITKLTKLGIICDLSKTPYLTVTDIDEKMEYLSDIIESKKKDDSAPAPFSKDPMTLKNNNSKKTSEN